ncbi:hypothetical protein ACKFKG_22075 [Phormidesmis sp. 146-35]
MWLESHLAEIFNVTKRQFGNHPPKELLYRFMLSSEQHWVIGIFCDVPSLLDEQERQALADKFLSNAISQKRDLSPDEVNRQRDLSRDEAKRRIPYMHLAYVIHKEEGKQLPLFNFDISIFKPLYEYVAKTWLFPVQKPPEVLDYQSDNESFQRLFAQEDGLSDLSDLNVNAELLGLYPNDDSYSKSLWYAFSRCSAPTSLLISEFDDESLRNGRFMNLALPNIPAPKLIRRSDSAEIPEGQALANPPESPQNMVDAVKNWWMMNLGGSDGREILKKLGELEQRVKGLETNQLLQKFTELEQRISQLEEAILQNGLNSESTEDSNSSISFTSATLEQLSQKYQELNQRVNKLEAENSVKN